MAMKIIRLDSAKTEQRDDGRTIKKLCQQELGMKVDNLNFIYVKHPANFEEKLHFHNNSFEIFFFLDSARYSINGDEYGFEKGDLVFFEPGDVHGGLSTPHEVGLFIIQAPAIIKDKSFPEVK